ncbi:MAG TPA: transcriptional repressor LexA [Clostridia bacterium]|nr:transcriptional repressor LexA [Clostridia bacterium]
MKTGKRIKELRESKNMTLEELGAIIGVQKSAVQKWENGTTKNLKRSTIQKLSEIFDVNPSYLMGMSNMKNYPKTTKVPLLGTIAAGTPILAEQNIEDYFNIDSRIKADFALKIKGGSMLGVGIHPGDIVFLRQQCTLENGEIGAVLIDNEATIKKFYKDNNTVILQAENDSFKPIILTEGNVRVLGKLIAVLNIKDK